MADGNLTLTIEADASGAISSIRELESAESALTETNESTQLSFTELNQALELAEKAWQAVSKAVSVGVAAISEGSSIGDVTEAFGKMSDKAGVLSDTLLNELRGATAGTITDLELMRSSLEATRAGAKPDEFIELTKAARVLAEETGGDLATELDQLSQAFETGQARALKNKLGVIDLEAAQQQLADSLGITADQLTKEGQIHAARTAILEAARKKTEEFGVVTDDAGDALAKIQAVLTNALDRFKLAIGTNEALNQALQRLATVIESIDFGPIVQGITKFVDWTAKAIDSTIEFGKTLADKFSSGGGQGRKVIEYYYDATGNLQALTRTIQDAIPEQEKLNNVMYGPGTAAGQAEFIRNTLEINTNFINQRDVAIQAADAIAEWGKAWDANLEARIANQEKLIANTEKEIDLTIEGIKKAQQAAKDADFGGGLLSGIIGGGSGVATGNSIGLEIGNAIASSIAQLIKTGDVKSSLSSLGGQLGSQFGPLGQALGEIAGEEFYEGLDHALGIGGSNDKGHKIRNSLHDFFASIWDGFDFGDLGPENSDAFFSGLLTSSVEVQQGFMGVGEAMNILLQTGEDMGGQIAASLTNNLGGSLNDLQLLVAETGFSFEQMKSAVVDAFLQGNLGAQEAETSLIGLQQIFTQGIPGAVGDTIGAFNNLIESSGKGRASFDALGDIAAEAGEKGITTLEGLRAELIANGASVEEVDKLFAAFAENGIDTLDELKGIGEELAINVLADLERSGFAFSDSLKDAAASADELEEKINRLDGKEINVDVNYRVNVSGDSPPPGAEGVAP